MGVVFQGFKGLLYRYQGAVVFNINHATKSSVIYLSDVPPRIDMDIIVFFGAPSERRLSFETFLSNREGHASLCRERE